MSDHLTSEQWTYFNAASSLVRAANIVAHQIDDLLKPHELTFARYEVLLLLSWSRRGRAGLTRIGDQLLVHQASVTGVVDRLEADGFVRRIGHDSDRRITLAQITNEGRLVSALATKTIAENLDIGVSEDHAFEVFELIQKLRLASKDIQKI